MQHLKIFLIILQDIFNALKTAKHMNLLFNSRFSNQRIQLLITASI